MRKVIEEREFHDEDDVLKKMKETSSLLFRFNNTNPASSKHQKLLRRLVDIGSDSFIRSPFICDLGSNIHIGSKSMISYNCTFLDMAPIYIGDRVLIGPNCSLITPTHPLKASDRHGAAGTASSIIIEDDAWLAANVTVLKGVRIGKGAVIAANSLVTKDVEPNTLNSGIPSKRIREL